MGAGFPGRFRELLEKSGGTPKKMHCLSIRFMALLQGHVWIGTGPGWGLVSFGAGFVDFGMIHALKNMPRHVARQPTIQEIGICGITIFS